MEQSEFFRAIKSVKDTFDTNGVSYRIRKYKCFKNRSGRQYIINEINISTNWLGKSIIEISFKELITSGGHLIP